MYSSTFHLHCSGGHGKLSPKRQYACEEDVEDQAQLTNFQSSTQETNILQPPSTSVTDSDGHQSALHSAGPSTSSVDSGMNSSHNSSSKLLQQDSESAVVPNEQLLQIEQSLSESKGLLGQVVKMMEELADRVGSLELQIQSINSHSQSGLSTESSNNQTSSSIEPVETVMESVPSNLGNFSDMQSTTNSKSQFASMGTPEQQRKRHYSDSKMTRHRRSEIKNKLGTVVPKSHSVIEVSV